MPRLIRVADVNELPPGKGKTIELEGRQITIVNQEGRYIATSTWPRHQAGVAETSCEMPGYKFDMTLPENPARLRTDELHVQVIAKGIDIFVVLEEGHVHPGIEPHVSDPKNREH